MRSMKLCLALTAFLLIFIIAAQTQAEISNAAVLYLRIAPGARAAALGEAYVAIADDATATHWNPAGLGNYPMSDSWTETNVPNRFRPITAMASVKARSGHNYLAYDIWAITPQGLARYDNKDWYLYEKFDTKVRDACRP